MLSWKRTLRTASSERFQLSAAAPPSALCPPQSAAPPPTVVIGEVLGNFEAEKK